MTKLCWLDVRDAGPLTDAVCTDAIHHRIDAIVAADPATLATLPPTVTRVLMPPDGRVPDDVGAADVVVRPIVVDDAASLERACASARTEPWTVLRFTDPTRIPLEIVLAASAGAEGRVITEVADPADATIVLGVLEHGPDGVLMAARQVGDAARLKAAAEPPSPHLDLVELTVTGVAHVGMGERACVDTCAYLGQDEGILVGSHARGLILCASETHPLPYMPTRPFRVNAGALMSYTLAGGGFTRYLSELTTGGRVLAVDVKGNSRLVTVGRAKIESRPLLSVDAVAPDGRTANVIVQDDWHVRMLGPGGTVLNSTALVPGDVVLGYLPSGDRHVGYPIDELCHEQ
jgi:3-amino-4-hydroxybenzoic acid synthase